MDNDISDRYREDVEALKSKLADKEEQIRLTRRTYRALQRENKRLRSGIGAMIIKYSCRDIIKPEQIVSDLGFLIGE